MRFLEICIKPLRLCSAVAKPNQAIAVKIKPEIKVITDICMKIRH